MNRSSTHSAEIADLPGRSADAAGPVNARLLGYSGVIPFAACAAVLAWGSVQWHQGALSAFMIYGAVILSFIGGIRWGAAVSGGQVRTSPLVISVLPSLWAAFFLWWPEPGAAVAGLMAGFIVLGVIDWARPARGMPPWMRSLRVRLTTAVVVCHLAVLTSL